VAIGRVSFGRKTGVKLGNIEIFSRSFVGWG